jgi:Skp family chaperone for outer membrane proteins
MAIHSAPFTCRGILFKKSEIFYWMNQFLWDKRVAFFQAFPTMATPTDHTHHIKIRSSQMEMPTSSASGRGTEDYDRKLREAQEELQRIQSQQEELERKKQELEELTSRKRAFVSQQVELTERLTSALTLIDRELFEIGRP